MRKNIFLRALYDFANSIVMIVFLFYFSQWLVVDQGIAEIWYNMSLVAASVLFILIAPYISKQIDSGASKIYGLRISTIICALLFAAVGIITKYTSGQAFIATGMYTLAMVAYLVCFLYYTPMLNDLATKQNHATISGWGQGVSSFGFVLGLIIMIPVANGSIPRLGSGRSAPLLPATVLFFLCALPMILRYNAIEYKPTTSEVEKGSVLKTLKKIFSHKATFLFLVAYFFYSDALLTFSNNYPLFLEKVHAIGDTQKSILTAVILLFASVSAFFTGGRADRIGLRKSLLWLLGAWCFIFPTFAFISGFRTLAIMSCVAGILYGPTRSVSRALFSRIIPAHLTATGFSFFIICERFATLVGPLIRGVLVSGLGGGVVGYKIALISMSVLVLIGWRISRKV